MKSEFQSLIKTNTSASGKTLKDNLLRYVSYWPLFLLSLLVCLGLGYTYIRYTVPEYSANTIINVKGETTASKNAGSGGDLISNAMNGGRAAINLDNELGRLRSARLMARVVRRSDLNISYYRLGRFTETDIFHDAPFRLIPKDLQDSSHRIRIEVSKLSSAGAAIKFGDEDHPTSKTIAWNQGFIVDGNTYLLTPIVPAFNDSEQFAVEWNPTLFTVYELLPKVGVNVIGKTSNIGVNITIENAKRGEDVLNKMVQEFMQMNLDDQNQNAQDKIYFIEDRLGKISEELKSVEKDYAEQQSKSMVIGGSDASISGESVAQSTNAIAQISAQKSTMNIVRNTLVSSGNSNATLPTSGVTDGTLSSLISKYNEAVLKRQHDAPLLTSTSPLLLELNDQIKSLRSNILDNLNNNLRALDIQASTHARQGSMFRSSMSATPDKLRVLNEVSREKNIKEQLYMYLLQKREETALSKSTTTPYEQIDLATSYGPISPDEKMAYVYAAILGLALPIVIIFIMSMINDKVGGRSEVENSLPIQIVGEINAIKGIRNKVLPSLDGGIVGEQFRIIRANLNFLQSQSKKQIILVTSSASGEGKSFVSLNLAAVIAKTGKKVALLEFDLRKPADSALEAFHGKGINDYLCDEASLEEIVQPIGEIATLDVYPSGAIIAEAGDLIVSQKVDAMFEKLEQQYDCIVINTPPVGLVGDALILQKYSTMVAYVIRQDYTKKKHLQFLNSLVETNKFNNTCIIYNGVKTGIKYGYYGYGYAKNNSYFDRNGDSKVTKIFRKKSSTTA